MNRINNNAYTHLNKVVTADNYHDKIQPGINLGSKKINITFSKPKLFKPSEYLNHIGSRLLSEGVKPIWIKKILSNIRKLYIPFIRHNHKVKGKDLLNYNEWLLYKYPLANQVSANNLYQIYIGKSKGKVSQNIKQGKYVLNGSGNVGQFKINGTKELVTQKNLSKINKRQKSRGELNFSNSIEITVFKGIFDEK